MRAACENLNTSQNVVCVCVWECVCVQFVFSFCGDIKGKSDRGKKSETCATSRIYYFRFKPELTLFKRFLKSDFDHAANKLINTNVTKLYRNWTFKYLVLHFVLL